MLFVAQENERYFLREEESAAGYYPEGFVLAQCVLPIVHELDHNAAADIGSAMVAGFPEPDASVAAQNGMVFRAIQTMLGKMDGIDCNDIGALAGSDFCPGTLYDDIVNGAAWGSVLVPVAVAVGFGLSLVLT